VEPGVRLHGTKSFKQQDIMARIVTFAKRNRREAKRFLKFMFVGATGAVVDFGVLNLLTHVLIVPVTVAGVVSFCLAVTNNFTWNRYWTYPESRRFPLAPQYLQFFIINATALLIRVPVLALVPGILIGAFEALGMSPTVAEVLGNNLALALAVGIAMFWNYFVNRFITYRHIKVGQ
jgi:putative flippase GtrA